MSDPDAERRLVRALDEESGIRPDVLERPDQPPPKHTPDKEKPMVFHSSTRVCRLLLLDARF